MIFNSAIVCFVSVIISSIIGSFHQETFAILCCSEIGGVKLTTDLISRMGFSFL